MPIKMFKTLFPHTQISDLNKSKGRKILFHASNNSFIPGMGVCRVAIITKGIMFQCSFFVVPGNRPELLGMPDCERLQLLSINCNTMNDEQNKKRNRCTDKSKGNKN